ncbi:MAG: FtsB family cell division protein [Blastocatellia bacterium]
MHRVFDGIVLAVILAACGICISYYFRTRAEIDAAIVKNSAASERLNDLVGEVDRLERDLQRLRSEPRAFEELARHRYGFVGADDVVIKLAPAEGESSRSSQASAVQMANLTRQSSSGYTGLSHQQ